MILKVENTSNHKYIQQYKQSKQYNQMQYNQMQYNQQYSQSNTIKVIQSKAI